MELLSFAYRGVHEPKQPILPTPRQAIPKTLSQTPKKAKFGLEMAQRHNPCRMGRNIDMDVTIRPLHNSACASFK